MSKPTKVLLGVCGGIAAYKAVELMRTLQRHGCEVRVMMTMAAQEFVKPLTFASLSGHQVYTDLWAMEQSSEIEHIMQSQWADVMVIAPATAHTIAKMCAGLADDFLSASYLAASCPAVLAPAMNVSMWHHAATQANLQVLRERGHIIIEPGSGYLACGMTGDGRLAEIEAIANAAFAAAHPVHDLEGETVLITAGGTREPVDAVRFLGNRSSGKMGYALASAANRRGARVIVISASGLQDPAGCEVVRVQTTQEMHAAVLQRLREATIVIAAAAVADYRVKNPAQGKLPRVGSLTLELEATEDIVADVVHRRKPGTLVIAFAAEIGMDTDRAREKLRRKGADAIVLNDVSRTDAGFDANHNAVMVLTKQASVNVPQASKAEVAEKILDQVTLMRIHQIAAISQ